MTPNIIRRLHADRNRAGILAIQSLVEEWELDAKFKLIASQLRAEPLGLCPLVPKVEYPIGRLEKCLEKSSKSTSVGTTI